MSDCHCKCRANFDIGSSRMPGALQLPDELVGFRFFTQGLGSKRHPNPSLTRANHLSLLPVSQCLNKAFILSPSVTMRAESTAEQDHHVIPRTRWWLISPWRFRESLSVPLISVANKLNARNNWSKKRYQYTYHTFKSMIGNWYLTPKFRPAIEQGHRTMIARDEKYENPTRGVSAELSEK